MVTLGGCKAGRFLRALASSLMLHATFPLDVLAQTAPSSTAVPAARSATPMPAETTMTEADRRQIQEALRRLDYYQAPVDGSFGPFDACGHPPLPERHRRREHRSPD